MFDIEEYIRGKVIRAIDEITLTLLAAKSKENEAEWPGELIARRRGAGGVHCVFSSLNHVEDRRNQSTRDTDVSVEHEDVVCRSDMKEKIPCAVHIPPDVTACCRETEREARCALGEWPEQINRALADRRAVVDDQEVDGVKVSVWPCLPLPEVAVEKRAISVVEVGEGDQFLGQSGRVERR